MRILLITGFVLMVGAQWYAPLSIIADSEKTLREGKEFRFKTAPVDPSDPFRGKYITLSFGDESYIPGDTAELRKFPESHFVYAILDSDSAGFAKISRLEKEEPGDTPDYMRVEYYYTYVVDSITEGMRLSFPFERFYLEESKASEAERLYWQSNVDSATVWYARVRVLKGDAKITDVVMNDSSIVDVVRRINAGK